MNISQLGYDLENETIVFCGVQIQCGDEMEVMIPSPVDGQWGWVPVRLVWENQPAQRWRLLSEDPVMDAVLCTCDPVGMFARK